MNSRWRLGQKRIFKGDIEGENISKQKRNGTFGHLCMLMGCPVGQMMLLKRVSTCTHPQTLTLLFFLWEKFHFNKEILGVVFFFNVYLFIYFGCAETLAACGLCFSCSKQGLFFLAVHRFLIMMESLFMEHRLNNCSTWAFLPQGIWASRTRDRTHVCCIGRWVLNCWTITEVPHVVFKAKLLVFFKAQQQPQTANSCPGVHPLPHKYACPERRASGEDSPWDGHNMFFCLFFWRESI